ncbi:hypothetical protein [Hephaestia mangrovi]|uniref:hypothetical protein n=1 Tax=Hephaestia mangrovi TaxID=2873268 RepID=UPI001CA63304|nr:hypothetical protein [Hephaestia mangrovi]MBY8827404.1 hypothetical protein [Hephaestia mangrovi]
MNEDGETGASGLDNCVGGRRLRRQHLQFCFVDPDDPGTSTVAVTLPHPNTNTNTNTNTNKPLSKL